MKTKRIKLRDLSRYTFELDEAGNLTIRGKGGRPLRGSDPRCHTPSFYLKPDDADRSRAVSKGLIIYLIKNPEFSINDIRPLEQRVKFTDSGEVLYLYDRTNHAPRFSTFHGYEEVIMTVMCIKEAINGNISPAVHFIDDAREKAIITVAKLCGLSYNTVKPYAEEGERQFLSELQNLNVMRIRPLFVWLCKCIKQAYQQNLKNISINKLENVIYQQ